MTTVVIAAIVAGTVILLIIWSIVRFHERDLQEKARLQEWNHQIERVKNMKIVVRTEDEIDRVLDRATDGFGEYTAYPNASYEEGICAFAAWLFGDVDFEPIDD